MSVISSCLTQATKIETQRGTLVTFLNTNGNARPSADSRKGEILIFFCALAFTHWFSLHTCKLGQCKRKVKTAWTCERPLCLHLRRACKPGLYKFWEAILQSQILTMKSCMIELQLFIVAYLSEHFFSS